jgi:Na+-translocating ferredoxin:NAD+ oxidoreductase RnfE subunit
MKILITLSPTSFLTLGVIIRIKATKFNHNTA